MNKKLEQRKATEAALLEALRDELAQSPQISAEGVARRADVNKALVYRYFGGLSGLLDAFGASDAFMPKAAELLASCPPQVDRLPGRERFSWCVRAYALALAKRPSTVRILLLLALNPGAIGDALRLGRQQAIDEVRKAFGPPDPTLPYDLDTAFNLVVAGICVMLGAPRKADDARAQETADALARDIAGTLAGLLACDAGKAARAQDP